MKPTSTSNARGLLTPTFSRPTRVKRDQVKDTKRKMAKHRGQLRALRRLQ
jgi:hypothetical protein